MQQLKPVYVKDLSYLWADHSNNSNCFDHVIIKLNKDFDPKTQAVILVDLEKDPQVWLENYDDGALFHLTSPKQNIVSKLWCSEAKCPNDSVGMSITSQDKSWHPDWIPVGEVAHMVCIGFLKPEEEQTKHNNRCAGCDRELDNSGSCQHCINEDNREYQWFVAEIGIGLASP